MVAVRPMAPELEAWLKKSHPLTECPRADWLFVALETRTIGTPLEVSFAAIALCEGLVSDCAELAIAQHWKRSPEVAPQALHKAAWSARYQSDKVKSHREGYALTALSEALDAAYHVAMKRDHRWVAVAGGRAATACRQAVFMGCRDDKARRSYDLEAVQVVLSFIR